MRRLLAFVLATTLIACGGDKILPAVTSAEGAWIGTQNGFSFSFNLTQIDSNVSGPFALAGVGGSEDGNASGTFVYPILHLDLFIPGFETFTYDGIMSSTQAVIDGHLNGSGFTNQAISVHKH